MCVSSMLQYALATYSPAVTAHAALSVDDALWKAACSMTQLDLSDPSPEVPFSTLRRRFFLSSRHGGMGFTNSVRTADAAYVGNWSRSGTTVLRHVPGLLVLAAGAKTAPYAAGLDDAIGRIFPVLNQVTVDSVVSKRGSKLQRTISKAFNAKEAEDVAKLLPNDSQRQQFLSRAGTGSAPWMFASPRVNATRIDDQFFPTMFKLRLGESLLPAHVLAERSAARQAAAQADPNDVLADVLGEVLLDPPTCSAPGCGASLADTAGDHALRCPGTIKEAQVGATQRHNDIRDAVARIARRCADTVADTEIYLDTKFDRKPGHTCGPLGLRADVYISHKTRNGTLDIDWVDVVVSTINPQLSNADKFTIGATAAKASRDKFSLYDKNYEMRSVVAAAKGALVPLSFEAPSGAFDATTHKWVQKTARRTRGVYSKAEYSSQVLRIMQHLSVALQIGNARMILHWQATAFPVPKGPGQQAGPHPPAGA
jgi:hypothetical protein